MKYKLLKGQFITNVNFNNPTFKLFENYDDLVKSNLILEEKIENNDYFNDKNLLLVVFFDGSVPKREIKRLDFNELTKELVVVTNKKDFNFSTMDYRMHVFVFELEKKEILTYKLI